jgi:alpha-1,2-mannosyltransferase
LPPPLVLPAAALLFALLCYATWRRTDPDRPWLTGAAAVSVGFLIVTPSYSWYGILIVPLVALGARVEWLVVVAAMVGVYLTGTIGLEPQTVRVVAYGGAGLVILAIAVIRRRAGTNSTTAPATEVALT